MMPITTNIIIVLERKICSLISPTKNIERKKCAQSLWSLLISFTVFHQNEMVKKESGIVRQIWYNGFAAIVSVPNWILQSKWFYHFFFELRFDYFLYVMYVCVVIWLSSPSFITISSLCSTNGLLTAHNNRYNRKFVLNNNSATIDKWLLKEMMSIWETL